MTWSTFKSRKLIFSTTKPNAKISPLKFLKKKKKAVLQDTQHVLKEVMAFFGSLLTQEACLTKIHIIALQATVTVPGRNLVTPVTRYVNTQEITVAGNEHMHLE